MAVELLSHFERKRWYRVIVDARGQNQGLKHRGALDVAALLIDVASIFQADFHLLDYRIGVNRTPSFSHRFT